MRVVEAVDSSNPSYDDGEFDADVIYHDNGWNTDTNGENYITQSQARVAALGSPDLLTRLDNRLREPLQEAYAEYADRGFGEPGFQDPGVNFHRRAPGQR